MQRWSRESAHRAAEIVGHLHEVTGEAPHSGSGDREIAVEPGREYGAAIDLDAENPAAFTLADGAGLQPK